MHISLDSALGQQRRLNQVGETISSIAAPTAAYSLRSLTGGDPKVVRVRRESDNHEQDFTASDVSSGALVDFVNSQVTAPLDIQEEQAGGRTGDFIIAKAAYSLRSLGTRQATVTSSGDTDGDTSGKYVCQVRSVTGDIKSFTADEVSDGTLVDFVLGNTKSLLNNRVYFDGVDDEVSLSSEITLSGDFSIQFSFVVTETEQRIFGKETVARIEPKGTNSISEFVVTMADASGGTLTLTENLKYGEDNTVKFKRVSDNLGIYNESDQLISNEINNTIAFPLSSFGRSRGQFAKCVLHSIRIDTNNDGTIDHSYNGYGNTLSDWQDLVGGNNASAVDGSPALFTGQDQDGFVKIWYDQSVTGQDSPTANNNHATQATAASQPEIVRDGSLLTAGVTFDGTDDHLDLTSTLGITSVASHFAVTNLAGLDDNTLFDNRDSSTDGYSIRTNDTSNINFDWLTSDAEVANASGQAVYYFNKTSSQVQSGANGGTLVTASESGSVSVSATPRIGARSFTSPFNFFNGPIQELIIYASDQTDNRTAIEANIGEHYSISGIPAFDNSVSGFVETWYDQFGSNNLTQATASKQPTIVTSGTLNTRNNEPIVKFIQANSTFLQTADSSMFPTGSNIAVTIFHAMHIDASSGNRSGVLGSNGAGNNASANSYRFGSFPPRRAGVKFADASSTQVELKSDSYTDDTDVILTYQFAVNSGTASFQAFNNGSSLTSLSSSTTDQSYSPQSTEILLGARTTVDNFVDSEFFEVIAYGSDQLSNRSSIEANLSNKYGISLS